MPKPENPETGLPYSVEHGCDYEFMGKSSPEYFYNFLDYRWRISGKEISARAYLDQINTVSVLLPLAEFDKPEYLPVLLYLQRRYRVIETFESAGYGVFWRLKT